MSLLKIGVQKSGRISKESIALLKKAGLDFEIDASRQLYAKAKNFNAEILFFRSKEIPKYTREGVCDLGIVGRDVVDEQKEKVKVVESLDFGQCRLSLAVPRESSMELLADLNKKTIATSFPNILKKFLKEKSIKADVIEMNGSVEIAPALEIADAIFDIVSSGTTLQSNGLEEFHQVMESEALLIQNDKIKDEEKLKNICSLLMRINSVLHGQKMKYVMMNAATADLESIKSIVPSLKSPTVIPLANPDYCAIHSVIPKKDMWDTVEKLKEAGAFGILVLPVENIF